MMKNDDDRTGIIIELEALLNKRGQEINDWFAARYRDKRPPFYGSVDLRHSCSKIVPVDTNLFPAGFNQLSERAKQRAQISFKRRLADQFPNVKRVMLLAESHTRNLGYLDNLHVLAGLLEGAGAQVKIARLPSPQDQADRMELETASGHLMTQWVIAREGDALVLAEGWKPDVIVMNNDLSGGLPDILAGISQPVVPTLEAGWHRRRKSRHFELYDEVAIQFAKDFGLDDWKIRTLSHQCGEVNFKERHRMDCVAKAIEEMLEAITKKYTEYGITTKPYVYIKADAGTYGMGIMSAYSPDDVLQMNKKMRNKMQVVKDGAMNAQVLVQEGVPTMDKVGEAPAEPMLYAVDGQTIGGAFRVNPQRDEYRNLNATGMYFTGMCDREEAEKGDTEHVPVRLCNFQVYGLITRMANLAAAMEISEVSVEAA
ncbi:MAG: glutamate--cysteine ligase [Rickettsiales bacterium]|nr:glutamate--cysteine ligase [Rickettsiales bacterium]